MSASICWRPLDNNRSTLRVSAPSAFIQAMRRAFGNEPWVLGPTHLDRLEAMAAVHSGDDECNPYVQIGQKIGGDDGRTIEIWPEY